MTAWQVSCFNLDMNAFAVYNTVKSLGSLQAVYEQSARETATDPNTNTKGKDGPATDVLDALASEKRGECNAHGAAACIRAALDNVPFAVTATKFWMADDARGVS